MLQVLAEAALVVRSLQRIEQLERTLEGRG